MPQVVASYIEHQDYLRCQELLTDLLESYLKDFPKYSSKLSDLKYLDIVFSRIPHLVGNRFKFVQISRDIQSKYLRSGLDLLDKADLAKFIYKTSAIPLGANYNPQRFKLLFLDIGLMQRACDLNIARRKELKYHSKILKKNINIQSIPLYAFGSWLEKSRGLA